MKKVYFVITLMVALALVLSACNTPQPTSPSAPQTQATATSQPQNQATPLPQATNTAQANIPSVLNTNSGLDSTDSYTVTFSMHLVGKDEASADVDQLTNMIQEVIRSKNASRMTWKSDQSDTPEFSIITLDKTSYMDSIGGTQPGCFVFPTDQATSQMDALSNENYVSGITPDTLVARGENVNGILTDHYTIKEALLMGLGEELTSAKGDVWVTPDGKYTIKYVYEAEGKFSAMNGGGTVTGKLTITYDLTSINQVSEISVPQTCLDQQQQVADLPMMADAGQISNISGMVTYVTAADLSAIKEFYLNPASGWTVSDDSSSEGFLSFKITKGDKIYNIVVTPNAGGGAMVIMTPED